MPAKDIQYIQVISLLRDIRAMLQNDISHLLLARSVFMGKD
jgi:hypothetical protein